MEANVRRGYLEVHDEKGSYRVPLGRRSRRCLMVLDRKEGEYVRFLEIDLFTGFVYYSVDNETSGGLSYYYDMSSKKVGHYFIHRYLRLARNHGFVATDAETAVFEKLPCPNWEEELSTLPGWKEALDNRITSLLLPTSKAVEIPVSPELYGKNSLSDMSEDKKKDMAGGAHSMISSLESITFVRSPAAYPARRKEYLFLFANSGDKVHLLHRDDSVGNEFFGEDAQYERVLSPAECAWLDTLLPYAVKNGTATDEAYRQFDEDLMQRLFPQEKDTILQKTIIRFRDGGKEGFTSENTSDDPDGIRRAGILQAAMTGLLRREIELVPKRT